MKAITNSKDCPRCGGGHKSRPFCLYGNGWHCFSCGYSKSADRSYSVREQTSKIPDWPEACSRLAEFSVVAQLWLAEYSITEELVQQYNIFYTQDNSLIFAVFDKEKVIFYQKRSMIERFITTYGQKIPYILNNLVTKEVLVIVEDYISAIRVNQAGYNVVCLWGTKVAYNDLHQWFKEYTNILVWLDNDHLKQTNSGQEAAKKIVTMGESILIKGYGFSGIHKCIYNVCTLQDPKLYSNTVVKTIVQGAMNG